MINKLYILYTYFRFSTKENNYNYLNYVIHSAVTIPCKETPQRRFFLILFFYIACLTSLEYCSSCLSGKYTCCIIMSIHVLQHKALYTVHVLYTTQYMDTKSRLLSYLCTLAQGRQRHHLSTNQIFASMFH